MTQPSTVNPCPRCGQPGEMKKSGSNRFWVQCSKFGKDGNCKAIATICPNKAEAVAAWNKMR
ncbi:endogenous inhibitor of DNA gyrase (YacG/DUF329 family) [Chitinivorax tropicus]|uniref:Endogenous inhibitor of DNA gyrase (YacG/DUF329 family) n=1 Tax=Chitinivorax tropicus TaxID=714531 RepID=A0A840MQE7_9PROT|nr:endogenous inhibitor of DNA gyrase (YacG/DUF329 family) [Chitinivorax tropicus]